MGGPVPPELVIGRTGEIEEIVRRLQEGISTLLQGERRIGKTTVCNAACDQIEGGVLRLEVPERRGGNSADLLQLIIDACAIASATGVDKKVLRALRPTLEKILKDEGIPLDLSELGAEPNLLPVRRILSLPVDVGNTLGTPIVFFLDELQRTVDYSDGEVLVRDLVDIYSGHRTVTVLVDGSDQRAFEMLYRDVQLDKLCDRLSLSETIPAAVWREALPARFEMADLVLTDEALALIVDFGAERPYPTMLAALHTALSARRLRDGAPVGGFEATMGIDEAKRQLDFGGRGV
ncbi:MAG TPA: hypothetical protein VIL73_08525 [Gaiellaceae bacterium]